MGFPSRRSFVVFCSDRKTVSRFKSIYPDESATPNPLTSLCLFTRLSRRGHRQIKTSFQTLSNFRVSRGESQICASAIDSDSIPADDEIPALLSLDDNPPSRLLSQFPPLAVPSLKSCGVPSSNTF
ncbi:hypothetical protein BJ322DRAFT_1023882 [Thelephora terrestris]|uniref:Uncharacterized protein n=1 Tax=Thelephora terrestris TaxID=56493 RepID=A0A9P6H732_9AGAM|nr:hypothetical protein BJ322DRAFT_1023882 [Thelephora terrestris]